MSGREPANQEGAGLPKAPKRAPCAGPPHPLNFPVSRAPSRGRFAQPSRRSSAVEQLIRNQQVIGSIPIVGSNGINMLRDPLPVRPVSREA
jgi:hypothetical protein